MITKNPNQCVDQNMVLNEANSGPEVRLQNLTKMFHSRGISQSDIDTTINVLNIMSDFKRSNEGSVTNLPENISKQFEGLKDLYKLVEKINAKEEKQEAQSSVRVKALYGILQQLPRNVYFSTKIKEPDDSLSSKHPSLYEALMEHTNITKKQLNLQLKVMRMSQIRFPLLVFTPPKRGLMLIKNDVNDVPPRPNQKVLEPEDVAAFYEIMKKLPRNTYFGIRPKSEPNLLHALNSFVCNNKIDQEDIEKMKIRQKDIRSMIPFIRKAPQIFPMIHFHPFGFNGSPWLLVKSEVNTIVVGGPKEESEGKVIVTESQEEAKEILEARARSIYEDIILKLKLDEKYSNGPDKMFFKACKEIKPNLVFSQFQEFIAYFLKNKVTFPQLKNIKWIENEKDVRGFVLVSENVSLEKLPNEIDCQQDIEMMEDTVIPANDTKVRGGHDRDTRMKLRKQNQLQDRIETLTDKLQALNSSDRKGANMQIRKHGIQQRIQKIKKQIRNVSQTN